MAPFSILYPPSSILYLRFLSPGQELPWRLTLSDNQQP